MKKYYREVFIFIFILIISSMLGSFREVPLILDDEIGYLSNAAYLAGYDWAESISQIYYYSEGYSLFLVPLFFFIKNPLIIYKICLLINSIFLATLGVTIFIVIKKIFNQLDKNISAMVAIVVAMYPSYIIHTKFALPEVLLVLMYTLIINNFLNIESNSSNRTWKLFIGQGILVGYLYSIHARTIVIMASCIMIMIILAVRKKITAKQFIAFTIPLVMIACIHALLKKNLIQELWLNSNTVNSNNYSGQLDKLQKLFSQESNLVSNVVGQTYYLGVSTYFISYIGIGYILKKIWNSIRNVKNNEISTCNNIYTLCFCLLSTIGTIMISSIFFVLGGRGDTLVYGRYNETILSILLAIGLCCIISGKINLKNNEYVNYKVIAVILFSVSITSIFVQDKLDISSSYNTLTSLGIQWFIDILNSKNLVKIGLIAFSLTCSIIIVMKNSMIHISRYIVLIVVGFIFVLSSIFLLNRHTKVATQVYKNKFEAINEIDKETIYYIKPEQGINFGAFMQFAAMNKKVIPIEKEKINEFSLDNNSGILSNTLLDELIDIYIPTFKKCGVVWELTDKKLDTKEINFAWDVFSIRSAEIKDRGGILATGNNDYFLLGPYIELPKGKYMLSIELNVLNEESNMGFITIKDENTNYYDIKLTSELFKDGRYELNLPLKFDTDIKDFQIMMYAYRGIEIELEKIKLTRSERDEINNSNTML